MNGFEDPWGSIMEGPAVCHFQGKQGTVLQWKMLKYCLAYRRLELLQVTLFKVEMSNSVTLDHKTPKWKSNRDKAMILDIFIKL